MKLCWRNYQKYFLSVTILILQISWLFSHQRKFKSAGNTFLLHPQSSFDECFWLFISFKMSCATLWQSMIFLFLFFTCKLNYFVSMFNQKQSRSIFGNSNRSILAVLLNLQYCRSESKDTAYRNLQKFLFIKCNE